MASALCDSFKTRIPSQCENLRDIAPIDSPAFEEITKSDDNIFVTDFLLLLLFVIAFGLVMICVLYCVFRKFLSEKWAEDFGPDNITNRYSEYIKIKEQSDVQNKA